MSHRRTEVQPQKDDQHSDTLLLLEEAAALQVKELTGALHSIAPRPGSLIYLEPKRLEMRWDDLQPVLFRAIDTCTHLQLGRLYHTESTASAVDFLQFMIEQFPFEIVEIRTTFDPLFTDAGIHQREHRFTEAVARRSIIHSIVTAPSGDPLISVLRRYLFDNDVIETADSFSRQKLVAGLANFLYFHNNHRALTTLNGKTPFQKLQSFPEFASSLKFDPAS